MGTRGDMPTGCNNIYSEEQDCSCATEKVRSGRLHLHLHHSLLSTCYSPAASLPPTSSPSTCLALQHPCLLQPTATAPATVSQCSHWPTCCAVSKRLNLEDNNSSVLALHRERFQLHVLGLRQQACDSDTFTRVRCLQTVGICDPQVLKAP